MPKKDVTDDVKKELAAEKKGSDVLAPLPTPFECPACQQSLRFLPLYQFCQDGDRPNILLRTAPMIQCAGCNAVYEWEWPIAGTVGGWIRSSVFADATRPV